MDRNYNLVLTGFMGTGKTTIGEQVAARLGRQFVDTDQIIRERLGKTVPEIFKEYGEPFFRAIEASICAELGEGKGLVVSTGGGALIRWENLRAIAGRGNIVICLLAEPDEILRRLDQDTRNRPLVDKENTHDDRKNRIATLLASRRDKYNRIRLRLDTTNRTVDELVEEVLAIWERELEYNKTRLPVWAPNFRYTIICKHGILDRLPNVLDSYNLHGRVVIGTNTTLAGLYGDELQQKLPDATIVTMPDGETYKNQATLQQLYTDFAKAGLDRDGIVLAFGGGVVGDTVGYAAATYLRGVKLVQIPTTLLAMVDSSVGGKVGVDIAEGKNLVGAFKEPELVIVDPNVLKTLPPEEISCGLAEAIKHGLIGDPSILDCVEAIAQGDAAAIRQTIQVKVDIVERDPYEQGERAHLNLGHTFAHAIEQVSGYTWRHGEAVAVGLVAAARLSTKVSGFSEEKAQLVEQIVGKAGLPTRLNDYEAEQIWQAMHTDKKWRGGRSHFVTLEDIGKPAIVRDVPHELVIEIIESLRG